MSASALLNFTSAEVAHSTSLGAAVLALNNAHAKELSWLERERLQFLVGHAFLARRIGALDAFRAASQQGYLPTGACEGERNSPSDPCRRPGQPVMHGDGAEMRRKVASVHLNERICRLLVQALPSRQS